MNRFIDRDRTRYLIKGVDAILNYTSKEKERSDEMNIRQIRHELEHANNNPPAGIITRNNNPVSMEKYYRNCKRVQLRKKWIAT